MATGVPRLDNLIESKNKVYLVMLHDNKGKIVVLIPATHLLDLVVLWRKTNRQLQPITAANVIKFFNQEALSTKEGQRKLFSLPVYMDTTLVGQKTLAIIEPHSDSVFDIPDHYLDQSAIHLPIGISPEYIKEQQPQGSDGSVVIKAVERFTALRVKQKIDDTLGLPSLPPTAQKISELRSDPFADVARLVPIVKVDPSLAAQVMSWAASPYYSTPGELQSIDDAVVRVLGFDLVVNLALGVSMGNTLSIPEEAPRGNIPYWIQALYTATLAERLCKRMQGDDLPKPGLVYLVGLIHNFGYAALAHLFPTHFALLSRYLEVNPHINIEQVERQVLNVTREQVAAWLFECWSLPKDVCTGVRHINSPLSSNANQYAQLVHIANRTLRSSGYADGPIEAIDKKVFQSLGLLEKEVLEEKELMLAQKDELLELVKMLEIQQKKEQLRNEEK